MSCLASKDSADLSCALTINTKPTRVKVAKLSSDNKINPVKSLCRKYFAGINIKSTPKPIAILGKRASRMVSFNDAGIVRSYTTYKNKILMTRDASKCAPAAPRISKKVVPIKINRIPTMPRASAK